jgi:hypothetical protein
LKVFKAKHTIIRTFDLVPKLVRTTLALDQKFLKPKIPLLDFQFSAQKELATLNTRSKVFIMQNNAFKTFDLVPKLEVIILALDQKFLN